MGKEQGAQSDFDAVYTAMICMDPKVRFPSAWNPQKILMRGRLTDKKIQSYESRGFYAADFRAARREMWDRRKVKREEAAKRSGNFLEVDGRLIYNP